MIESLQKWVFSTFGVDLFLTLALMGLTAHIVMVGINDWQPYRRWLAFLLRQMRFRNPDSAPVTKADLREILAAHNQEIRDIRLAVSDLQMEPLGTDGTKYARLPDGTNVVKLPDGTIRLAFPVQLSAAFEGAVVGRLSAAVLKTSPPEQGKPDDG